MSAKQDMLTHIDLRLSFMGFELTEIQAIHERLRKSRLSTSELTNLRNNLDWRMGKREDAEREIDEALS